MRICFVTPDGLTIRGGSKRVIEYASRLGHRGHEVFILGPDRKMPDWLASYYSGVKFADISKGYKDFKTDVAIATGGRAARRLSRMRRAKVKVYSVVMLESLNKPIEKRGQKIDRDRFLRDPYGQGWIYYANSSWMKEVVEKDFGQKCHLILAPPHERMRPVDSIKPKDKLWVCGYGGQSNWKGGRRTADAVAMAKRALPNLEMIHYSQRSVPRVRGVLAKHWSNPPQDFLPTIYSSADIFCHFSRFEGFANTCAEALSCGTPVISCRTPGIEDIVIHGETGWIIGEFDVAKMAEAIVKVLTNQELYARLKKGALEHMAKFSWDKTLLQLEEIFSGALRSRK